MTIPTNIKRVCGVTVLCLLAVLLQQKLLDTTASVTHLHEAHMNPEFAVVVCHDKEATKYSFNGFQRQLRQLAVLLKSAAALTSTTLKFNIVSDSLATHHAVTNLTEGWPSAYRQRVLFGEYKEVFYPPGTEKLRNWFRPCATARLFLAQAYEDKDALLFVDTDMLFLRPPEDLWRQINDYGRKQMIGMAPALRMYRHEFPVYGKSILNAGALLMNATRIRAFPGGWAEAIMDIVHKYGSKLGHADQDILNTLFSKAVFDAWEQYQLGAPLLAFSSGLNSTLTQQSNATGCSKVPGIDEMLLTGLMNIAKKKELVETEKRRG